MDFLTRVARYLFWLLVVSWSMWLLKKTARWMLRKAMGPQDSGKPYGKAAAAGANVEGQSELAPRKLVRDPVCGVYVAEVLAIPMREGGELLYFCSKACREKYAANEQRMAANG